MTVVEFLLRMKNLIRKPGTWIQNKEWDGDKAYCLFGAHNVVYRAADRNTAQAARHRLHQATTDSQLVEWNDKPGRTQDQVLNAIDDAIRRERLEASS